MKKSIITLIIGLFLITTYGNALAGCWNHSIRKFRSRSRSTAYRISRKIHPNDRKVLKALGAGTKGYAKGAIRSWHGSRGNGVFEQTGNAVMGGSLGFAQSYLESEGSINKKELHQITDQLRNDLQIK